MVKALENLKKCEEDTGRNSVLQVRNEWCQSFANSYGKKKHTLPMLIIADALYHI
jgi:hypothetical protein